MAERWGRVWTIGTWERVSKAHSRRAGEICCTHSSTLNHSGEKPGVVLGLRDKGQSTVSSNSLDPSGHQTSVLISSHHMLLTTPYTLSSSGCKGDALSSRTQKMLKIKHSTLMQWDFREEKHLKVIWENEDFCVNWRETASITWSSALLHLLGSGTGLTTWSCG